jgi:hypothetical protein
MGLLGLLFQRSFKVLRVLDDKERTRQAGRMGLDRMTAELREATLLTSLGATLEFEKIDPNAVAVTPSPAPTEVPDDYEPPAYTPAMAYPNSARLEIRYSTDSDQLIREVRVKGSGAYTKQVVVAGVNAFNCTQNPDNEGEVEVTVSVLDNGRVTALSSRILCPCIKEVFQ